MVEEIGQQEGRLKVAIEGFDRKTTGDGGRKLGGDWEKIRGDCRRFYRQNREYMVEEIAEM